MWSTFSGASPGGAPYCADYVRPSRKEMRLGPQLFAARNSLGLRIASRLCRGRRIPFPLGKPGVQSEFPIESPLFLSNRSRLFRPFRTRVTLILIVGDTFRGGPWAGSTSPDRFLEGASHNENLLHSFAKNAKRRISPHGLDSIWLRDSQTETGSARLRNGTVFIESATGPPPCLSSPFGPVGRS